MLVKKGAKASNIQATCGDFPFLAGSKAKGLVDNVNL